MMGASSSDPESGSNTRKTSKHNNNGEHLNGFFEREAKRVARNPCIYLWTALLLSIGLSFVALVIGEFEVSANTGGWWSRGTLIADRQQQLMLTEFNQEYLFYGGNDAWDDLLKNVQPGWEDDDDDDDDGDSSRRLSTSSTSKARHPETSTADSLIDYLRPQADRIYASNHVELEGPSHEHYQVRQQAPFQMTPDMTRRLQEQSSVLDGCDIGWYSSTNLTEHTHLWPVWKTQKKDVSALSPQVIHDICVAEQNTQKILEDKGLCFGCEEGCLPPYSIVLYARLLTPGGLSMTCSELLDAWGAYEESVQDMWTTCVSDIKKTYSADNPDLPETCQYGFSPALIDEKFDETSFLAYTSSIFATTYQDVEDMFDDVEKFDRGSSFIKGAYDSQYEDFINIHLDSMLTRDMSLAMGSAVVVAIAILIHTRSPFITIMGLLQIIFSFPLAYFVYKLVAGLVFFPFLNFIGVFVVFALGADDVFVAVDKWKNARLEHPKATTEHIAAIALPDAAGAMLLTTSTTAVAFFATAICPVAPVRMFAIFLGLLVTFDYLMNILLVFPALCIYDIRNLRGQNGFCASCCCCCCCCFGNGDHDHDEDEESEGNHSNDDGDDEEEEKQSLIRWILSGYYWLLHKTRWGLFVTCFVGLILCSVWSAKLEMPTSSDVRLLEESHQFEQSYLWRQNLLLSSLDKVGGSRGYIVWGLHPEDTGDHNDPGTWSQLRLDGSFDPSSEDAQLYLAGFCDSLYEQEFASVYESNYTCPINSFDEWLQGQANSTAPDEIYVEHCANAESLPVPQENFHSCISAWSRQAEEMHILSRDDKVQIMYLPFSSRVRYDAHFDVLDKEWNLIENWMKRQNRQAPQGVRKGYFSSDDFWWYDTNHSMMRAAYSSAGIALAAAALVILISSRSVVLTFFATVSIAYVLTSVTSTLVAMGWTLGFLEAICFAILIGISVDFVIHFSHAYSSLTGEATREDRTKYALIHMGPSILAAAFTTMASATIMLFTVITFFQKFALVLFFTVIQATAGSFVVFLTMAICIGPSDPTYLVDSLLERVGLNRRTNKQAPSKDDSFSSDIGNTEREKDAVVW